MSKCKYRYVVGRCKDEAEPGEVEFCEFHLEVYKETKEREKYTSHLDVMLSRE